MKKHALSFAGLSALYLFSTAACAEDYVLTLKGNQFTPTELSIPAGQKVKITVKNLDATPAEFESYDLNREKIVGAHSEIALFVGPLSAGSYEFFDEFHRDTAKGKIVVK